MGLFKNVFGGKNGNDNPPPYTDFEEGDYFYCEDDGHYQMFKVLKSEKENGGVHVMMFWETDQKPTPADLPTLPVKAYHAPIAVDGFTNPQFLAKGTVEDGDLIGYLEFVKQTNQVDEIVKYAQKYYKEAYQLTDEKKYDEAIARYSLAIEVMPGFFEAIDNRAFCKMDLGRWEDAIADFEMSLQVEPEGMAAVFSIGECYLKMRNLPKAREYFERGLRIDPNHELSQRFLKKTIELMGG
jgi:tetratricopeptide (TPR) repeat protein